ncbi:MAG: protein kinase [Acidobacteriota bacterium]|nr:protein kinase [Acidobacteriota bacterium]
MQEPGTLIEGKYEILGKIREGGMGTIYKVRHRLLDEIRVVKVMRPSITADAEMKSRFVEEAKMATRLKHPNVGTIHDFALDDDGTAYLVMEFIDGVNLAELRGTKGPPRLPLALEIAHQALLALGYLHRRNVIHRDVAPDNLMLTQDEEGIPQVKLIDLGIAKALDRSVDLTSTGVFLGKLKYASPEQYGALPPGEKLDGRSDLYCLGVVLYELMTDFRPFAGVTPAELLRAHLFSPPLPFEQSDPEGKLPPEVRRILLRALEKKREDRYPTAEEFDREIVALRHKYGTAGLEHTLQILSTVRQTPVSAEEPTITPSAQSRLDRQFVAAKTPTESRPQLTPVWDGAGEAQKTAIAPGTDESQRAERPILWVVSAVITLVAIGLVLKRPWEPSRSGPSTRVTIAPALAATTAPRAENLETRPTLAPPTVPPPTPLSNTPEPTTPPRAIPSVETAADRVAAEQARRLVSRARANAERVGASERAPGPYGLGRRAEGEGDRLMAQRKFSAAQAAFEKSVARFSSAEAAVAQLTVARSAAATPIPLPTRPEPTRVPATAAASAERPRLPTTAPAEPTRSTPPNAEKIRETIRQYEKAQNTLDADLYARAFPSVDRDRVRAGFESLRSQILEFEIQKIEIAPGGASAVVRGYEKRTAVPRVGGEQRLNGERVIHLEKRAEGWVIVRLGG